MALILDTGPLVALLDRSDPDHDRCRELINAATELRIVPVCTLVEIEYQLRPWRDGFAALMSDIRAGRLEVHVPDAGEVARAAALVEQYADLPFGLVDASVLACVERLRETKLATLDRRHFSVVRPAHIGHLELLPD
ncbi:type II toxin-antitoxin system VapC family toxin [Conexibacter sp. S30A1]|uniref:type II toxin-antitoxin system VapC family toxin n=1 Tax=Conexibacter sp. S30A1 TaxID=2937800 RepID=UPI002010488B|nr:PIN domain-containing protein [Conexibacter sp. S30A1]